MNKEKYLSILVKELYNNKVDDIDEIIAEYEEHFDRKILDGYSEEEIAVKLEKPEIIAKQFVIDTDKLIGASALTKIGLTLLDVVMIIIDVMLYCFVIAFGAIAIGLVATGVCLLIGGNVVVAYIPIMPVIARMLFGISVLALSVMATVGTIYYSLFVIQLNKVYFHWHKKVMTGRIGPGYSVTPKLVGKMKHRLRSLTLISSLVFVISFAVAYVYLTISAGAFGFWHVWHWFE